MVPVRNALVLVDDGDTARVRVTGRWTRTSPEGKFGRTALRHDGAGAGEVRFVPAVSTAGRYHVYLYWPRSEALSARVPVIIGHATGIDTVVVNMRDPDEIHGGLQHGIVSWVRLGEYRFGPGGDAFVTVRTGGNGEVFADAALLVPVRETR